MGDAGMSCHRTAQGGWGGRAVVLSGWVRGGKGLEGALQECWKSPGVGGGDIPGFLLGGLGWALLSSLLTSAHAENTQLPLSKVLSGYE